MDYKDVIFIILLLIPILGFLMRDTKYNIWIRENWIQILVWVAIVTTGYYFQKVNPPKSCNGNQECEAYYEDDYRATYGDLR